MEQELQERMEEVIKAMKLIYDLMASEEFASAIAQMYWNIYRQLERKGFTEQQSLTLLASMDFKGK